MSNFADIRRDISLFLSSLRFAVDRPFRGKAPIRDGGRERFMKTILLVEEARIRFQSYTRYREEPTSEEWQIALENLIDFTDKFVSSTELDTTVYNRPFRLIPTQSREKDLISPSMGYGIFNSDRKINVLEAVVEFRDFIKDTMSGSQYQKQETLSFTDIKNLVPHQQVAPIQFEIIDDRIIILDRAPRILKEDKANILSALDHIRGSGDRLIENLMNSNCDPRLLDSVRELQEQLVSDGNIVKIGLTNMACSVMSSQFQSELPDVIAAMFNSYNASVSLYVAQFPEWEQFAQNASQLVLDDSDIAGINDAAMKVVKSLEESPGLVDPKVPKTIEFIRQFLLLPGASAKRASFAIIRTLENLVSSIVRHSADLLNKTVDKTVEGLSSVASRVILALLGIALISATGIAPAAMQTGAPWVKQVVDIIQKQIESSKKN